LDIYVYSDESGVFDKAHNDIFVFGGIIFFSKKSKDIYTRKYIAAERVIRWSEKIPPSIEVKATTISNKSKGKLYRSLNQVHKFGVIINQQNVLDRIFASKKDKQRYLDYAYKICVKREFEQFIHSGIIVPSEVKNLRFYIDEHTTATNGCYELREGLEQEFKRGTYNMTYDIAYPPIFPDLNSVHLQFCNSASTVLVRAADIVANKIFYLANKGTIKYGLTGNLFISRLP
jgi:hypothetical protein